MVLRFEWLTRLPVKTDLPVSSQRRDMILPFGPGKTPAEKMNLEAISYVSEAPASSAANLEEPNDAGHLAPALGKAYRKRPPDAIACVNSKGQNKGVSMALQPAQDDRRSWWQKTFGRSLLKALVGDFFERKRNTASILAIVLVSTVCWAAVAQRQYKLFDALLYVIFVIVGFYFGSRPERSHDGDESDDGDPPRSK